jgi:two-component sensor histidine kinase
MTFGLALLPLALLSFIQTRQYEQEANARAEAALLGATVQVAGPQVDRLMQARGTAAALAPVVGVLKDDVATCSATLRAAVVQSRGEFSYAAFIPPDGIVRCASANQLLDLSGSLRLQQLLADPKPVMNVNPRGPVSGESVLIFTNPVLDRSGVLAGFLSVSVPHRGLSPVEVPKTAGSGAPLALITFDEEGTLLTSSIGLTATAPFLPEGRELPSLVGVPAQSFTANSATGESHVYAVVPLVRNHLYVLAVWPRTAATGLIEAAVPSFLFPVLMWAASLLVALVAAELQVLRHIRALRETITQFADGSRALPRLDFETAPAELRDVGEAYERMAESVIHDEAELEDTIHQKEVLLREVHHRVKNNLQLIASIINMQIRKAQSAEAKVLMKGLQDRVMGLATIHRELYQTSGLTDIRADELLQRIVRQLVRMGAQPGLPFEVETRLDDIRLTPDQAVPLSLLLTETLANALKYSIAPPGELPRLSVSLRREREGQAVIEVVNSAAASTSAPLVGDTGTGLGEQLIRAFVQQLGGTIDRGLADGHHRVTVTFPVIPLSHGEERASG